MRKRIVFIYWFFVIGWMGTIFYLSTIPAGRVPQAGTLMPDYLNHAAAYFILAFFLFIALQHTKRCSFSIAFSIIIGSSLIYGLSNEIVQHYSTITRHFSLWDLLADVVGAGLLFLFLLILQKVGNRGRQIYFHLEGNYSQAFSKR